jgi:hypothetical protein
VARGGAEGEAHGEFAAALEGAGDEEAEAVEAGDGEDEEDGALEEEELAREIAEEVIAERAEEEAAVGVVLGELGAELGGERGEFGFGGGERAAGGEFAPEVVAALRALGGIVIGAEEGGPGLGVVVAGGDDEIGGHHADDVERSGVELDGAADDGGIGAEAAAPERIGEDDGAEAGGLDIRGRDDGAERGARAHEWKDFGGDALDEGGLGGIGAAEGGGFVAEKAGARKRGGAFVERDGVAVGDARGVVAASGERVFVDHEEARGVAVGERAEEEAVEKREDNDGGGEGDAERRDDGERERGGAAEGGEAVAKEGEHGGRG